MEQERLKEMHRRLCEVEHKIKELTRRIKDIEAENILNSDLSIDELDDTE